MAAWTLGDVDQEIKDVSELVSAKNGKPDHALQKRLLASVVSKIRLVAPLRTADVVKLYSLVENTAWPESMKNLLKEDIDKAMAQDPHDKLTVAKPQTIKVPPYLTKDDWQLLEKGSNHHTKLRCIASRLRGLGLRNLSEQSVRSCVACLVGCYPQLPSYDIMHQFVSEMKLCFGSMEGFPTSTQYIGVYPSDPKALPLEMLQAAYPNCEPMGHTPDWYCTVANHVPLRKTSKLLVQSQAQKPPQPPQPEQTMVVTQPNGATQPSAGVAGVFGQEGFGMIAQTMMNMNTMLQNLINKHSPRKQKEVEVQISKSPKEPKALEDAKASSSKGDPGSGVAASLPLAIGDVEPFKPKLRTSAAEPSASKSVAEIEEQTFLALKGKSNEKKGADGKQKAQAKAKGKSKAKAQPKPKAQPKAQAKAQAKGKVMKRPSSCLMDYEVRAPTKDDLLLDPDVYTSREWHRANAFALKTLEMTAENAKVYAKGKREVAKDLYKDAKKAKAPRKSYSGTLALA